MEKVIIKRATKKNIPELTILLEELVNYHHKLSPKHNPPKPNLKKHIKKYFEKEFSNNKNVILIAKVEGVTAGYILGEIVDAPLYKGEYKYWVEMIITEKYRSRGIGRKLIKALVKFAKSKNIKILELEVYTENKGALNAWRMYGFREYTNSLRMYLK